ncbi:amino acid permease [Streptomyces sp. NPDC001228]|uniref:APC family permease n=1 Tax=Streptomyces sp. NPDC001228 TaxID=3154381 RepID=UPI003316CB66
MTRTARDPDSDVAATDRGGGAGEGNKARKFGLPVATALVMGNIVGGGIFVLPASAAPFGTVSLVALAAVSLGAIALALVLARLARRNPGAGGPYAYAREAFGDFAGFISAWSHWLTSWVTFGALTVVGVGYLGTLIPLRGSLAASLGAALVLQWLSVLPALAGTRGIGVVQIVAAAVKFVPLVLIGVGGLVRFDPGHLGPLNATGSGMMGAVSGCAAVLLFSYVGLESAAVSAGGVRDARRNVGRATVLGTSAASLVYLLCTLAVFGVVASERLASSTAPFSEAANAIVGGSWGGAAVACLALVSIFGALNGFALLGGQVPQAAARDRLFPYRFAGLRRGIPVFGIFTGTVLVSLLTTFNHVSGSGKVLERLVLVTTFTATVPYLLSAAAQIRHLVTGRRDQIDRAKLVRESAVAVTAAGFSAWLVTGVGYMALCQGALLIAAGAVVYLVMRLRGRHAGRRPGTAVQGSPHALRASGRCEKPPKQV